MESSAMSWLSEMGLDNSFCTDQCDFMDSVDEEMVAAIRQDLENCLFEGNNSSPSSSALINIPNSNSITSLEDPLADYNYSNFSTIQNLPINYPQDGASDSTPIILNFGHANSPENPRQPNPTSSCAEIPEEQSKRTRKTNRVRPPSQTYDHIIAERKRREQLSQRFVALSTIVPGLKKMDKTSVLGDAIKYLKHLQERVKTLEEQATKQTMESAVFVKKSQIAVEDEWSSDEKSGSSDERPLPEIEARVYNSHVLLRVQCEKQKELLVNLLSEVEKLNLAVVSTNVSTFGSLALDITIVAEMENEFNLTMKEVVKRLRAVLQHMRS